MFAALSAFYDAVAEPVLAAGGDIVKMIADGILAVSLFEAATWRLIIPPPAARCGGRGRP